MRARLLVLLLALVVPAGAFASVSQESLLQDDSRLLYASDAKVDETLGILEKAGVDRVRVTLLWRNVAPSPKVAKKPAFDAADPDAYPAGAWDPYDRVTQLVDKHGIRVLFRARTRVSAPGSYRLLFRNPATGKGEPSEPAGVTLGEALSPPP